MEGAPQTLPQALPQGTYQVVYQALQHAEQYQSQNQQAPSTPPVAGATRGLVTVAKSRQNHYKPFSTETSTLSMFLFAALIFIAAIEVSVRRGLPVTTDDNTAGALQNQTQPVISNSSAALLDGGSSKGRVAAGLKPSTPGSKDCIGIEIIVSEINVEQCNTASPGSCSTTATQITYEKPIYNTAIPTMPCYKCAIEAEGIELSGFMTATTTHCASCGPASSATIYPCPTCEGTILSTSALWEITPTATPRLYTSYTRKEHDHTRAAGRTKAPEL